MGKEYTSEALVHKAFWVSMVGVGLFIAAVFLFIL
jgi:cbb3-type cytochrome oxidase subunit 1